MEKRREGNASDRVVVKKVVHASREQVFDAWTKPELMKAWYVGGKGTSKSTVDLRVGGKYTNEMFIENGGCSDGDAGPSGEIKSYMHHGEYLEISKPSRLVFTWNSPSIQNTKVIVDLKEVESGTEVTITHELLPPEECKSHHEGWTFALAGLGAMLG